MVGLSPVMQLSRALCCVMLACRLLVAGHKAGDAPGCAGGYVVLSGRLSDVRGFNDFLQDFLVQVRFGPCHCMHSGQKNCP